MEGETNEKALLYPKKSIFSKKFKVTGCSKDGCVRQKLSREQKTKLDNCNYEGRVVSDPDSKVSLIQCNENGVKDVSIVSEKVGGNIG